MRKLFSAICLISCFFSLSSRADDPSVPAEYSVEWLEDLRKKSVELSEQMATSQLVEVPQATSFENARLIREIRRLSTELTLLQWRSRPVAPDWEAPENLPPEVNQGSDPKKTYVIELNDGTLEKKSALRKGNAVFIDNAWVHLRYVYRGISNGKPIYAHPRYPFPKLDTRVVHYGPNSATSVTRLPSKPKGIVPYGTTGGPAGHYADIDEETGAVRWLVFPPPPSQTAGHPTR
jgi:hypothetical protein